MYHSKYLPPQIVPEVHPMTEGKCRKKKSLSIRVVTVHPARRPQKKLTAFPSSGGGFLPSSPPLQPFITQRRHQFFLQEVVLPLGPTLPNMKTTWKDIPPVPTQQEFLDIVLSRTQRKLPTQIRAGFKISRIRGTIRPPQPTIMPCVSRLLTCPSILYSKSQVYPGDLL